MKDMAKLMKGMSRKAQVSAETCSDTSSDECTCQEHPEQSLMQLYGDVDGLN